MSLPEAAGHILWEMYDWPGGIVVGNLIASAITSVALYVKLHLRLKKQHREQLEKLDTQHAERMTELKKLGKILAGSGKTSVASADSGESGVS